MLNVLTLTLTPFAQNTRILYEESSTRGVVIDPGGEVSKISAELERRGLSLGEVWLTHSHLDHCGGVQELIGESGTPLIGHKEGEYMRANVLQISEMYGLPAGDMQNCPEPTKYLTGGETISIGAFEFSVLFTPGHAPDHLCFYCESEKLLIAGDTLFAGSIGRTDLPGGNQDQLFESIRNEIYTLPGETKVLPGHGPDTTVDNEKHTNPFVRAE